MWADVKWLASVTPAPSGVRHQGCVLPWGASREAQGPEPGQKDQNRLGRAEERRCLRTGEVGWEQRVSTGGSGAGGHGADGLSLGTPGGGPWAGTLCV